MNRRHIIYDAMDAYFKSHKQVTIEDRKFTSPEGFRRWAVDVLQSQMAIKKFMLDVCAQSNKHRRHLSSICQSEIIDNNALQEFFTQWKVTEYTDLPEDVVRHIMKNVDPKDIPRMTALSREHRPLLQEDIDQHNTKFLSFFNAMMSVHKKLQSKSNKLQSVNVHYEMQMHDNTNVYVSCGTYSNNEIHIGVYAGIRQQHVISFETNDESIFELSEEMRRFLLTFHHILYTSSTQRRIIQIDLALDYIYIVRFRISSNMSVIRPY